MQHKAAKFGTAFAAAALGLGLPALASAQELPPSETTDTSLMSSSMIEAANAPDLAPIGDAMASVGDRAQRLAGMGPIAAQDVFVVSFSDMGLTADQRYTLMQNVDPSGEAALQQTLANVQVDESESVEQQQRSLTDHLRMIGVDPASVVAVDVGDDGIVTLYVQ